MLASFEDAEDAVQETFLQARRRRGGLDGGRLQRAWLYRSRPTSASTCAGAARRDGVAPAPASAGLRRTH
jgi:RNA polymerase sigma-70 factor (ECF subfamily)